jgi:hypothetical protein
MKRIVLSCEDNHLAEFIAVLTPLLDRAIGMAISHEGPPAMHLEVPPAIKKRQSHRSRKNGINYRKLVGELIDEYGTVTPEIVRRIIKERGLKSSSLRNAFYNASSEGLIIRTQRQGGPIAGSDYTRAKEAA